MQAVSEHPFWKMSGIGNEIIVLDLRAGGCRLTGDHAAELATLPDLRFDQLMVLLPGAPAPCVARVAIFNTDGSRAGACGNGMRCVGRVVAETGGPTRGLYEVDGRLLEIDAADFDRITVDMGTPRFAWNEIPLAEPFHDTRHIELQIGPIDAPILHSPAVVSMGNPHAIFWVDDVETYDLGRFGPMLENHPIFPERANITLAQVTSRSGLRIRTWERGAGLTLACGSAACAAAVSAARTRRTDRAVTVVLPGGTLDIIWREDDHVLMTGAAEHVRRGKLRIGETDIEEV